MSQDPKRLFEIRLLVIVSVDVTETSLIDALGASRNQPSSLADIVSSEVVSNLESVPYVAAVIVSQL